MKTRTRKVAILLGAILLVSLTATHAFGQVVTGTLSGTVEDPSGAVIPNASVTVTNQATGVSQRMKTGPQGLYTFPDLNPGTYGVTITAPGFKTTVAKGNVVQVEQSTEVDVKLQLGHVAQQVVVSGETPLVQTTTSDIGLTLDTRQINSLPVNGRLFEQLMQTAPGSTPAGWTDQIENPASAGSTGGTGDYTSVNGFPFAGNLYLIDGVSDIELLNAYINLAIPLDFISEMKVETGNPSARYGTFGGAVLNVTTKTGTNHFHGQIFEYNRNSALFAKDYFTHLDPSDNANQFGGELGGPIIRNKLFFAVDYQQLKQDASASSGLLTVPTAAMRTGDLSAFDTSKGGPILDASVCATIAAANGEANPLPCTASAAIAGTGTYDTVPASDIAPIAANFLNPSVIPLPTLPSLSNNLPYSVVGTENMPQYDVRIDYAFSSKDHFFARASYANRTYTSPAPVTPYMSDGNNSYGTNGNYNDVIGWDHFFSSNMINQLRIGFNRYATYDFANLFGTSASNKLGIPNGNIATLPSTNGVASIGISGFSTTGGATFVGNGLSRLSSTYQYNDQLTLIRGRNDMAFGISFEPTEASLTNPQIDARGQFGFSGGYTATDVSTGTSSSSQGSAFADFLIGAPNYVERDIFTDTPATRVKFFGLFAQDNVRVNRKLTLNLGLRWDLYGTPVDAHNNQSNFVLSGPHAGLIQIASSSNRPPNVSTYYGNIGPRLGFAYSPDSGKTAFRGAFGISYFPSNFGADGGTLERNYPELLIQANSGLSNSCLIPTTPTAEYSSCGSLLLSNGLPGITPGQAYSPLIRPTTTPGGYVSPPAGFGVYTIAQNDRQDEAEAWNLSIERQLTPDMALHIAYVGTAGKHLYNDDQLNQCSPKSTLVATSIPSYPACLPFYSIAPTVTTVDFRNSGHSSHYNSGQVQLIKRTGHGLTLTASYTWSKMMDNISNPLSPQDLKQELATGGGFSTNSYPQAFILTYVYELPFGRGRTWMNSGSHIVNDLVGDWQLSGITNWHSGAPLLVGASTSDLLPQAQTQRADYTCGVPPTTPHKINEWFDTSCFSQPTGFRFGNGGVAEGGNYGPRYQDWDVALDKSFQFGANHKQQLKLTANYFNVFNHVNLGNPDTNVADSNFGAISSDVQARQAQLGMTYSF